MNRKRIAAVGGIAAAVCLVVGAGIFFWMRSERSSDKAEVYVSTVSSLTETASGAENRYAGVVEPQKTVKIKLESKRKVKDVKVSEGQSVKTGDVLFEYDMSSNEDDLAEAQLDLERLQNEALSLKEQMETYEKEKQEAQEEESQLSYTIQIQTAKMDLKKNEYNQKSKQAEIDKLQSATGNTEVRSSIDGVIQKIDTSKLSTDDGDSLDDSANDMSSYSDTGSGSSNAFITILSTGSYRVKGTVNELNIQNIVEGEPVIVRSRVDSSQIWHGTMGTIDKDSATTNSNSNSFGMMDASGDSQTSSSTYPFYVNLDSSDGLMLGQHVYIENDEGQEDQKAGLWLSEVYISDTDTDQPYVWAMGKDKKLEKRSVILGQYDEELGEYEIADGLTKDDYIAYPAENLKEGMATTKNREEAVESDNVDMEPVSDMSSDELPADDNMDSIDYGYDGTDDTMISDYDTGDMTDGDLPDEDLVPIQDDTEAE